MHQSPTNRLIHETSPYLLQHAHNPVDWYPWGEEALQKAKQENKPILVSIGYAACHWCHVMERESFEDESTAELMNLHFINIKIDREERPDLDHIYMDAVQAMTGSGGWPLNVFLTPDAKPFFGGTYFPPKKAFNRSSWKDTLNAVRQAFEERRHEIDAQAENLTEHISQSNHFGQREPNTEQGFTISSLDQIADNIMKQADPEWGGFGKAPKFPQTFSIQYLLRLSYTKTLRLETRGASPPPLLKERGLEGEVFSGRGDGGQVESKKGDALLNQALFSLDKMIEGGIYDQVGGGFARYSTDAEWLAPHFEKMLYDNALLVSVLSEAYQFTQKERYREVIDETMDFISRELLDKSNGFYSALDADSEGEEGKFYVWELDEAERLLKKDAAVFCSFYDITKQGNREGNNILRVKKNLEQFAKENDLTEDDLKKLLSRGKKILLDERSKRIRPLLDDKIILGWNALMNTATSKAFAATGNESYRQLAIDNMHFLFAHFKKENSFEFNHTWKNKVAKFPAFLDDYAFLVQALLHLYEITTDRNWLVEAKNISTFVFENFGEDGNDFFYFTSTGQTDVIVRKKELYDGAIPSGNAIMAYNLHQLSLYFDITEWNERAKSMINSIEKVIIKYPTSFGNWACLMQEIIVGTNEIVLMGSDPDSLHLQLLNKYLPNKLLMVSKTPDEEFPLLRQKQLFVQPAIYLCRNYTCLPPVFSLKELMSLINNPQNG